jgi:hypothetical protein
MLNFVTITGVEKLKVNFLDGPVSLGPKVEKVLVPVTFKKLVKLDGVPRVIPLPVPVIDAVTVPPGYVPIIVPPAPVVQVTYVCPDKLFINVNVNKNRIICNDFANFDKSLFLLIYWNVNFLQI